MYQDCYSNLHTGIFVKKISRQERIINRNKRIVKDYIRLSNKRTPAGAKIYTHDYILEKLSDKYALAPATIEAIVYDRINYSWQKNIKNN